MVLFRGQQDGARNQNNGTVAAGQKNERVRNAGKARSFLLSRSRFMPAFGLAGVLLTANTLLLVPFGSRLLALHT